MIRSTKHHISHLNLSKSERYKDFIREYRRVASIILDQIWENGYEDFSIQENKLNLPKYFDYNKFPVETTLSARALNSVTNQLRGIIQSTVDKRRKGVWKSQFKEVDINSIPLTKPDLSRINPELSSKNNDIIQKDKGFDYVVRLSALGKSFGHIKIPIKETGVSKKWKSKGKLLNGISLSDSYITLRFEIESKQKDSGITVGADQGMKTVMTFSNESTTPESDIHGHSLDSICTKLSRKKKGSKAFKRSQDHRKNYINWSINQLNLSEIKQINLEKVVNINYGKNSSRKMKAWTNTLIRDKLKRFAEENEVRLIEQPSVYRSQRCSCCGQVRKANRKGKLYSCKNCGNEIDADLNAAKNHEIELPEIPFEIRSQRMNLGKGFYWRPDGFFILDGTELRVLFSEKTEILI